MYTQVWTKFLPVIRIMLKRAVASPQVLKLNRTDFDKAGGGKKVGFRFTVELKGSKVQNKVVSPIAKDLITAIQQDPATTEILAGKLYELDLNPKCELSIRYTSVNADTATEQEANVELASTS
jgi:hypothetical protein